MKITKWFTIVALLSLIGIVSAGTCPGGPCGSGGGVIQVNMNGSAGGLTNFAINNTFTTEQGTNANVVNVGNAYNILLDFFIPTGADAGMNMTPNMTAGPEGPAGPAGINGTTPVFGVDYFDGAPGAPGINGTNGTNGINANIGGTDTQVIFNNNMVANGSACMTFDNSTGTFTACYLAGDGSALTGIGATAATALTFNAKACAAGTIYKGQAVYISGASGSNPIVCHANNTDTDKSRVVGIMVANTNANSQGTVRRAGTLSAIDSRATNGNINPLGQTWGAGDLLFATTGGGLTNVRPTSGRSVKVAYTIEGSSNGDTLLAYPMENPVWITAASGESVVLRTGDIAGATKVSIRNYTNTEVAYVDSLGNATFRYITGLLSGTSGGSVVNKTYVDNKANLTQYSYISLMAGSGIIPATNPPSDFNQLESATNKNNWIYANITNGTSQNVQWLVDMPADWNNGNIVADFLWSVQSGSGDVNWTLSGVRLADNVAIDTALPLITYKVDTVQTANYMHVSADTTAAGITGTGNTVLFKVARSSTSETLTVPAQLIGVRLKYITTKGAA